MKKLGWLLLALITFTAFTPLRDTLSPNQSGHIQATIGRKAFMSMNSDAQGLNARYTTITKFGQNLDIDSAADESITPMGDAYNTRFGLGAETLSVVSSDTADDASGTGARTILLGCIGADGLESSVIVTMDGTTPVVTTAACKFINRGAVLTSGSGNKNAGTITITQSSSSVVMAIIPALASVTKQLEYYVPSDRRCYFESLYLRSRKLATGSARVHTRVIIWSGSQETEYEIRDFFSSTDAGGNAIILYNFKAEQVRPNEIIAFRVGTSSNGLTQTGNFELVCRRDND
jgi:hypothetical protein